jgi:hypothetical protein
MPKEVTIVLVIGGKVQIKATTNEPRSNTWLTLRVQIWELHFITIMLGVVSSDNPPVIVAMSPALCYWTYVMVNLFIINLRIPCLFLEKELTVLVQFCAPVNEYSKYLPTWCFLVMQIMSIRHIASWKFWRVTFKCSSITIKGPANYKDKIGYEVLSHYPKHIPYAASVITEVLTKRKQLVEPL